MIKLKTLSFKFYWGQEINEVFINQLNQKINDQYKSQKH